MPQESVITPGLFVRVLLEGGILAVVLVGVRISCCGNIPVRYSSRSC
jgi:hypothetical protein